MEGATLVDFPPTKPLPIVLQLHPDLEGEVDEVVQVQLTQFASGSLAVGFTTNHAVANGHATCDFLVAWGRTARALDISGPSPTVPTHNQPELFRPRNPPVVNFEHRGVEYFWPSCSSPKQGEGWHHGANNVIIHTAHFTKDFIAALCGKASEGRGQPFSRFETTLTHVWRTMTRVRGLSTDETCTIRICVDGRRRLSAPSGYFVNLVLWAFQRSTVGDLLSRLLKHAAQSMHDAVARLEGAYFQSLVDFTSSDAVEREGLEKTAVLKDVMCPDMEVESWLTFPFYELDFGAGSLSYFMPSQLPIEGMLFLVE